MKTKSKRLLSILLAVLMAVTGVMPAFSAFAEDGEGGIIGVYELQIFYENGVIVPDFDDEEGKVAHIEHMKEGEKKQMKYYLKDCTVPDNGWIEWESDTPTVCDVTADGLVRAFDSSKGAAVRLWIDNEVATVPVVGKLLKTIVEKALFNDKVNVDTMDTEQIIEIVDKAFGEDSVLAKYIESYKGQLITSFREYLDKVNTNIYCRMYDKDGNILAEDSISVTVHKSDDAWADLIPNGTHITNKQKLPTTVAKGTTLQLNACTTPTRLHMGVIYSVKNSSIFSSGKVVATVDSSGLVTFKNTGTVTILVSPDTEGFIDNLLKYINLIVGDMPDANGKVDCGKIADVLIKYVGLDINRTVLIGILEACFVIADIAGDTTNPVRLTKTAAKVLANLIYQFTTNDSITFTVVDGVPVTDFEITGTDPTEKFEIINENGEKTEIFATPVKEGDFLALGIGKVKPEAADTSDIVWTSSDPATASVDPETGVITGRDVGTTELIPGIKTPKLRSDPVLITATSKANNISKSVYITVKQKTGEYITDAEIAAERTSMNIGESQMLDFKLYPERIATSRYLTTEWGIVPIGMNIDEYIYDETHYAKEPFAEVDEEGNSVVDENGEPVMNDGTVTDGIGKIDSTGVYTAVAGGKSTIVFRAVTGLETFGIYNKISEVFAFIQIDNGRPVGSISVWTSEGDIKKGVAISPKMTIHPDQEFNGKPYHYATIDYAGSEDGLGVTIHANVMPEDVSNKKVNWVIENTSDFKITKTDDANGTVTIEVKGGKEKAVSTNVYCVSQDGTVTSDMITVAFSKSPVKGNKITTDNLEVVNGKTASVSHEPVIDGNADKRYACYNANWYSDDEDVAVVESIDDNGNAVIRGTDVGTTTLHCVSADGGVEASCKVTVYPDKDNLNEIISLCERTTLRRTDENEKDYDDFLYQLDTAYYISEDVSLASQTVVDNVAQDLLYLFYKLGGYIGINGITILDKNGNDAPDYISVKASTSKPYTSAKYALGYRLNPENTMYKSITWKSSNESAVKVDRYGVCRPVENKACYATITVTVTDYFGETYSDSTVVAFANTPVTGISVSPSSLSEKQVGGTAELEIDVKPKAGLVTTANITDIIWTSSDESVAAVTPDSKNSRKATVEFKYGGDCVITATSVDGGYTAECAINVVTNYEPLIEAMNKYTHLVLPPETYYPDTYKVYSDAMAKAQAMVDAKASTQNEVKAMIAELDEAYLGLQKYNYITGLEIYREGSPTADYYQYDVAIFSKELIYTNVEFQLNVRLYPNNASYDPETVQWTSSNPDIEVDSKTGICRIVNKRENMNKPQYGKITFTVADHFGHVWSDDVNVSISRFPVTGISFKQTEIIGKVGETKQIGYTITPEGTPDIGAIHGVGGADIKALKWESDDESVATVDENGVVTFVAAGLTTVKAITLDGGFTAECTVSTEGNRKALGDIIDQCKDIDYTDYDYYYGMQFKEAYEAAQRAMTDYTLTQSKIDTATQNLISAKSQLEGHEFRRAETIGLNYKLETQANRLASWKEVSNGSGAVANDVSSYSYKTENKSLVDTRVTLSAFIPDECKDNYNSITIEKVSASKDAVVDISGTNITVKAPGKDTAYAVFKATATDVWGRTLERIFRVTLTPETVTGISLDQTSVTKPVTTAPFTLTATVNPSGAMIKDVIWSTSDSSVATVENGVVTPVNTGTCIITAETADGGFKANCTVTFETDYSVLAALYAEKNQFLTDVIHEHIYTSKSLEVLQQALSDAGVMLSEKRSSQQQVDEMVAAINNAFDNLVLFVGVTGAQITVPEGQENVSVPNDGFVRYQATVVRNGSFRLEASALPEDASPESVKWTSDNTNITVDENGVVTKSSSLSAEHGIITAEFTDEAGNTASAYVYVSFVISAVEGISFSKESIGGRPGTTQTLKATVSPALASVRDCIYESSDPEIASVDNNGVVTFNKQGETTITATSLDGGFTASYKAVATADTSALEAGLEEYKNINYMDYAYEYGTEFKAAYENAQAVSADFYALQAQVDEAVARLQTAYNALAGHEFVSTGEIKLLSGDKVLANGMKLPVDDTGKVSVTADYNKDAMLQSAVFSTQNESGVEAEITADGVVITKTTTDASGSLDVVFTTTDDYGRQNTVIRSVLIVDAIVPISSIQITYNGEEAETAEVSKTLRAQLNGATIQLGLNIYPANAEEPGEGKVLWTASGDSQITVDQNGLVKMGIATSKSYTSTITCTVIRDDGTTVTDSITVSFTSKF